MTFLPDSRSTPIVSKAAARGSDVSTNTSYRGSAQAITAAVSNHWIVRQTARADPRDLERRSAKYLLTLTHHPSD
jgi:hypothetical protein